jgi:hypothetical protein
MPGAAVSAARNWQRAARLQARKSSMLTATQSVFVVLLCIILTLTFLLLMRRFWPSSQRREHNEIIGWQVSVLGTTYAVIMGFMLYAVWTDFNSAEMTADSEANSLVSVYRLSEGLAPAERDQIQKLARDYTDAMLNDEWPAMSEGNLSASGHHIMQQLWATTMQSKPASLSEQTSFNHVLNELTKMTEYRRLRELQSKTKLPGILWTVLIVGGIITTMSACMFGTDNFKLHAIQVFSLSLLLALALVAIADIDRPFRGAVRVAPGGFEHARDTFAASDAGFK